MASYGFQLSSCRSFSSRHFPAVENSSAERHVIAITQCFREMPENLSLQSFHLIAPVVSTIIILFTLLSSKHAVNCLIL